jgi:DNA recombination protein RmuC
MFVPTEAMYSEAMVHEPDLLRYAQERNVMLANPMTLMTLLYSVAHLYRLVQANEEAAKIRQLAEELCERLGIVGSHLERVGKNLKSAVQSYNEGIRSFETRLFATATKIQQLGVSTKKTITLPTEVDSLPVAISRDDLRQEIIEAREADELPEPEMPTAELPEAPLVDD